MAPCAPLDPPLLDITISNLSFISKTVFDMKLRFDIGR